MFSFLDSVGSVGALVAALACPACFPIFAALSAALGFGVFRPFEGIVFYIFQGSAVLTLAGLVLSFRQHRHLGPLIVGALSCVALAYHSYWSFSLSALYSGLFGLIAAAIWNHVSRRKSKNPILESTITCPKCGHRREATMPLNACLFFYDGPACHVRLKPMDGDCCVFCSYSSVPCPPVQTGATCCS